MTVQEYTQKHFGLSRAHYEELVTSMRIVDDNVAMRFIDSGSLSAAQVEQLAPMPAPKEIFKAAFGFYRGTMADIDKNWGGDYAGR